MTDNDLIRRGDALKAVQYHVTDDDDRNTLSHAISALPAVTVGVPTEAQFMDAVWIALKSDATDLGKQQRILAAFRAALEPVTAPDPETMLEWLSSFPPPNEKLREMYAKYQSIIKIGRLTVTQPDPAAIREAAAVVEREIEQAKQLMPMVVPILRGVHRSILALIQKGTTDDRA